MIIGLATPAFSPFQWSPLPALNTKPSCSNTHLSLFDEIGVILLILHLCAPSTTSSWDRSASRRGLAQWSVWALLKRYWGCDTSNREFNGRFRTNGFYLDA